MPTAAAVPTFTKRPSSGASTPILVGDVFCGDGPNAHPPLNLDAMPPTRAGAKLPSVSKRGAAASAAVTASVPAPITIPTAASSPATEDDGLSPPASMRRRRASASSSSSSSSSSSASSPLVAEAKTSAAKARNVVQMDQEDDDDDANGTVEASSDDGEPAQYEAEQILDSRTAARGGKLEVCLCFFGSTI